MFSLGADATGANRGQLAGTSLECPFLLLPFESLTSPTPPIAA